MARISPCGARSPGGDPFALSPAPPPVPANPAGLRYDPRNVGRMPSLSAAIHAVGHSTAHVRGPASPGANPSPEPPVAPAAVAIRGFRLPKSLAIACNAVGSTVQITGLHFSPRVGWSSPCGLSPALVPAPRDSFAIRGIPYVPLGPPVRRAKRGQHGPGRGPGDAIPPMGELTFESALKSGTSFALNPDALVRRRRRMTEADKAALVTHDDVLEYKREGAADWLVSCVPADLRDLMLGGDRAIAQCPDPAERDAALRELFMSRAGRGSRSSVRGRGRGDACQIYLGFQSRGTEARPAARSPSLDHGASARPYGIWSPLGPAPRRPVGIRPSRRTPACGLGLTGRVTLGMYGQPEGERWRVSAGPILTLPIVLVTTVRPIHIHTVSER
jgi:hypothetical protein